MRHGQLQTVIVTDSNGDEITNGTDPLNADTDGDGGMMVKKLQMEPIH
jgi:hypothetical protein